MADTVDVVVVGAGPAGSLAAGQVARRGARVLLVERAAFPREKVCGGCLMPPALEVLHACGLGGLPSDLGAVPLTRLLFATGGRRAAIDLPGGVAVSRGALDAALASAAVGRGAILREGTHADVGPASVGGGREVVLRRAGRRPEHVRARVVLAADGLAGRALDAPRRVVRRSRLGAGAVFAAGAVPVDAGSLFMHCGAGGYVGLVRAEAGRVVVAAALDPRLVRRCGGLGAAVAAVLAGTGGPGLPPARWRGTPRLTRRPARPWAPGVLAIGDTAGYVEPFTGEGMAWALTAARAVSPFALDAVRRGWREALGPAWARSRGRLLRGREARCRLIAGALRVPWLVRGVTALLERAPAAAAPLVRLTLRPAVAEGRR